MTPALALQLSQVEDTAYLPTWVRLNSMFSIMDAGMLCCTVTYFSYIIGESHIHLCACSRSCVPAARPICSSRTAMRLPTKCGIHTYREAVLKIAVLTAQDAVRHI